MKKISLPSGATAEIPSLKMRDVLSTQSQVGNDTANLFPKLFANRIKVDGKKIDDEGFLDLDGDDYLHLLGLIPNDTEVKTENGAKKFTLPDSGCDVIITNYKARHVIDAQRASGKNPHHMMAALISQVAVFNGKKFIMEDVLDKISWIDGFAIMAQFGDVGNSQGQSS